jgi:hypothetical protein
MLVAVGVGVIAETQMELLAGLVVLVVVVMAVLAHRPLQMVVRELSILVVVGVGVVLILAHQPTLEVQAVLELSS